MSLSLGAIYDFIVFYSFHLVCLQVMCGGGSSDAAFFNYCSAASLGKYKPAQSFHNILLFWDESKNSLNENVFLKHTQTPAAHSKKSIFSKITNEKEDK